LFGPSCAYGIVIVKLLRPKGLQYLQAGRLSTPLIPAFNTASSNQFRPFFERFSSLSRLEHTASSIALVVHKPQGG
jgi:hypothetical protein